MLGFGAGLKLARDGIHGEFQMFRARPFEIAYLRIPFYSQEAEGLGDT